MPSNSDSDALSRELDLRWLHWLWVGGVPPDIVTVLLMSYSTPACDILDFWLGLLSDTLATRLPTKGLEQPQASLSMDLGWIYIFCLSNDLTRCQSFPLYHLMPHQTDSSQDWFHLTQCPFGLFFSPCQIAWQPYDLTDNDTPPRLTSIVRGIQTCPCLNPW